MQVIATEVGYRDDRIVEVGTMFELKPGERLGRWMTPAKVEDGLIADEQAADKKRKAANRAAAVKRAAAKKEAAATTSEDDPLA